MNNVEIKDDVNNECSRFGNVLDIIMPRPLEGAEIPGLKRVLLSKIDFCRIRQCSKLRKGQSQFSRPNIFR